MKNIPLLLAVLLFTGCMHNYDLTLVNGMKITHVSRPKLDRQAGLYTYTDVTGKKRSVSCSKVVEIGPHTSDKFSNGPAR